ncbi:hypothetical protein LEP1GSC202_3827 [Leptospira yanagawae serovar Saopaulo str. Sao Paulo = ATCC 700523]|uniref:Uncharacterized protein n=1 Tax=Leptospira yanagawae serovar Saopaulo str. Sao Paulo = ATCC 700523 TaxID=1249483 RepID=A0A5E8HJ09_9LEPT|nr:hypothetical protein LEP1GSC202_3827 [Leptospira yanagawae serovar Saopaulo str. Sao Paulo = ATCC 700523]
MCGSTIKSFCKTLNFECPKSKRLIQIPLKGEETNASDSSFT